MNCFGKRATPDVALDADPNTGVAVYDSTPYSGSAGWWVVGGTSASTPMWAAASADAGVAMNSATVYTGTLSFRDITSGNNKAPCLTGYDLCSGRGSWLFSTNTTTTTTSPTTTTTVAYDHHDFDHDDHGGVDHYDFDHDDHRAVVDHDDLAHDDDHGRADDHHDGAAGRPDGHSQRRVGHEALRLVPGHPDDVGPGELEPGPGRERDRPGLRGRLPDQRDEADGDAGGHGGRHDPEQRPGRGHVLHGVGGHVVRPELGQRHGPHLGLGRQDLYDLSGPRCRGLAGAPARDVARTERWACPVTQDVRQISNG